MSFLGGSSSGKMKQENRFPLGFLLQCMKNLSSKAAGRHVARSVSPGANVAEHVNN